LKNIYKIIEKVELSQRISLKESLLLYKHLSLSDLIYLANKRKTNLFDNKVFFIENIHIEPTNKCFYSCKFCSFNSINNFINWDYSLEEIKNKLLNFPKTIKEIHVTGGINPSKNLKWYIQLFKILKENFPDATIKALTAIEIDYLAKMENKSYEWVLKKIKDNGVLFITGGGAEIFDENIRKKLCPEKGSSELWINIHKLAHKIGLKSNATILYGHIENYAHRIKHLEIIRNIQDETNGFLCFVPLKYRNKNNFLNIRETSFLDDIRFFCISRIFLDNIPHLKSYWPMFGINKAIFCLHCGADDLDGTIYNTTNIFASSGSEETNPSYTKNELIELIKKENLTPVERDSFYNVIKKY